MKTFDDCKKEVARKRGWNNLVAGHLVKYFDEAAEIYANQFHKTPTEEEIENAKYTEERSSFQGTPCFAQERLAFDIGFRTGVNWRNNYIKQY